LKKVGRSFEDWKQFDYSDDNTRTQGKLNSRKLSVYEYFFVGVCKSEWRVWF